MVHEPNFHTEIALENALIALDSALIQIKRADETYRDMQTNPESYN
jgi:hypothetical protein